jgi:hypothetical protein
VRLHQAHQREFFAAKSGASFSGVGTTALHRFKDGLFQVAFKNRRMQVVLAASSRTIAQLACGGLHRSGDVSLGFGFRLRRTQLGQLPGHQTTPVPSPEILCAEILFGDLAQIIVDVRRIHLAVVAGF